jgi:hypothetical protein
MHMATMYIEAQSQEPRRLTLRKGRRSSMSVPALIWVSGQKHSAQLHNLSCGGAMVQSAAPVHTREPIVMSCGSIEVAGRVVWVKGGCFGVEFHTEIADEQILRQLHRSEAIVNRRELRKTTEAD